MSTRMIGAGLTDVGRKREYNEDNFAVDLDSGLLALADGMGGHAAGEVASQIAVETVAEFIKRTSRKSDITWPYGYDDRLSVSANRLRAAFRLANERIFRSIEEREELRGMGTTFVALLSTPGHVCVAHVGDSRAYLCRDHALKQITTDHSWVNEQVLTGQLTKEQAAQHPFRNVITRALGSREEVAAEINDFPVQRGDRVLLCSDGLTTMLDDDEILKFLDRGSAEPLKVASELIARANEAGGDDNITVIIGQVE